MMKKIDKTKTVLNGLILIIVIGCNRQLIENQKTSMEGKENCNWADIDSDMIIDADDKCVNDPETYNGFEDEDGCPDHSPLRYYVDPIEIRDKIEFKKNTIIIDKKYKDQLDTISAYIKANKMVKFLIVGKSLKDEGNEEEKKYISIERAKMVFDYLISECNVPKTQIGFIGISDKCYKEKEEYGLVEFLVVFVDGRKTGVKIGCLEVNEKELFPEGLDALFEEAG